MSRSELRIACVLPCLLGIAAAAPAQEAAPADSTTFVAVTDDAGSAEAPRTGLDREVAAIRANFSARLAALTTRYRAATDPAAAAAAQREIGALKGRLELDLLDLQLRLARERQDAAAVSELEQVRTAAGQRLFADTGLAPADTDAADNGREGSR